MYLYVYFSTYINDNILKISLKYNLLLALFEMK